VKQVTAWIAVYAFALNMVLTSALLASISPLQFDALDALCFNSGPTTSDPADGGKDRAPLVRCQLCLSPTASALPPEAPAITVRVADFIPIYAARREMFIARPQVSDCQARGPPRLI
jgi:hypothetical protein